MGSQNQHIIYLFREGFDFYVNDASPAVRFVFPESVVKDLDVLHKTELHEAVKAFIDQNQIVSGECIIVVSEHVYFEKDFTNVAEDQKEATIQGFVDTVPFESSFVKTFPIAGGWKVAVVNKDLCTSLQEAFTQKGFIISAITPVVVLGTTLTEEGNGLTVDSIRLLFEKYSVLKQNNFLTKLQMEEKKPILPDTATKTASVPPTKQINKKVIGLVGVFIILVLILIGMLVGNFSS